MNRLCAGVLGCALFSLVTLASASASDSYVPGLKDRPVVAYFPLQTWTGFYIGGNIGGVFPADNSFGWRDGTPVGNFTFDGRDDARFIGGFQAGFNWQRPSSPFVLGIEADVDFADHIDWLSTIRGRIGYATPNALFYATGGGAFIGFNNDQALFGPANFTLTRHGSRTDSGWVAGGGVEFTPGSGLFFGLGPTFGPNLTFGVEGLFYSFGDNHSWDAFDGTTHFTWGRDNADFWTVRAKLNYYFDTGVSYRALK